MEEDDYCWYCGNDFIKDGLCRPCKEQDRERLEEARFSVDARDFALGGEWFKSSIMWTMKELELMRAANPMFQWRYQQDKALAGQESK